MYPKAYIDFLILFHGPRDYFECHEVLEEFWKQNQSEGRNSIWVGLIQVAVALYHHRIGNFRGSYRTLKKAIHIIEEKREIINGLGIDTVNFLFLLNKRLSDIKNEQPYHSINIPISDTELLKTCSNQCLTLGFEWNSPSNLSNNELIYKHSLRDRTEIIKERENQRLRKTEQRKKDLDSN